MTTVREKIKNNPEAAFAKKENVAVAPDLLAKMNVIIPPVYYWEEVVNGKSEMMTMAFQMLGRNFGMSYSIEDDNIVKIDMLRKKLFWVVRESLDVVLHHGEKVLDIFGNIDPKKVNDEEALRFKYDTRWMQKVAAFNKLVRIAPITKEKAVELGLLDKPKVTF